MRTPAFSMMQMDTSLTLTTESAAPHVDSVNLHAEAVRLFHLGDRWLAQALLVLSRAARRAAPALRPDDVRQDSRLVWDIAPEIARRLGARQFLPLEAHGDFARLSLRNLRSRLDEALVSTGHYRESGPAWALLTLPPEMGNVVAFGMDRLCVQAAEIPDDTGDLLCRRVAMACAAQGLAFATAWHPGHGLRQARSLPLETSMPPKVTVPLYQIGYPA
jgi:hypothetical protein